ncbi:MAG TPA: SpoIIE family protein phosphatase, partial [Solirubrobacter sp.]|nr:SpoIIE family protein phosphatase [Solirubrobacter sp.]
LRVDGPARAALAGGGEVGRDLLAVDWAATPLGPPEGWPRSLASIAGVLLTSRFSMWMAWGPDLTFFCNAAYRRDTLGTKYPWALGRPAREVWAEIWPDIGPRIETVLRTGEATWDEALLLFLERSGYLEETYHTFSYSPLAGDDGAIEGMLCVVSEDTKRVIGERRLATLRDVGSATSGARTEAEVLAAAVAALEGDRRSLPFALVYLFGEDGRPRLSACSGIAADHSAAAALEGDRRSLPFALVYLFGEDGRPRLAACSGIATDHPAAAPWWPHDPVDEVVAELDERFEALPTGAWHRPPRQALVVPLGQDVGFLVAALNRFRPLDDGYRGFVALVAGQIAAGLTKARAYEAERLRAESLLALDAAKTAFFTNVSHELRTPLTLLLGPAEDALVDGEEPLPDGQRARVERINRNAQRLLKLVNTLLDFSRLQSGRQSAAFAPAELARHTAELASMFESAFERAGLTLTIDCPPLPQPVHVDAEMWAKIVMNLLSNALKFTFVGGVTVRLRPVGGAAELTVTDTGIGIEPGDQERLFERFHRIVGARSRTHEGTGIGLALVAELAALHGGAVGVVSAPGEGTSFTVRVPFGTEHLPAEQVVAAPVSAEGVAEGFVVEALRWFHAEVPELEVPDEDGPRVLVVDDNADMRDYIASLLAGRYRVETAPDGAVALELARREPPDLVVTDVMMPNLDGFGLLTALHAEPATTAVPVLMVSARAGEDGTIEGLEAGADDYLVKPFAARELLARVHANLELDRARRTRDALRRGGDLLDQAQRLARVGSWELDLSSGEFSASAEFLRQVQLGAEELRAGGFAAVLTRVHPEDEPRVRGALATADEGLDLELRLVTPDAGERVHRVLGEVERGDDGRALRVRGSSQDVTDQRAAERALAAAAAEREAAARERSIAEELQRSLLPQRSFDAEQLDVAAYYRAGVAGTQVGGDWYDVIDLGAGRTALVLGDVVGRGVPAAAVMGQLRAAVRGYAQLELAPADVLESLGEVVSAVGPEQLVTCLYAVFDPRDQCLTYANAGHLPPLLVEPGELPRRLDALVGPPLGVGALELGEHRAPLVAGTLLALYTDGLVERRDRGIDVGIDLLAEALGNANGDVASIPDALVGAVAPDGSDDDVALLVARTREAPAEATAVFALEPDTGALRAARGFVAETLAGWGLGGELREDALLVAGELVTNAVLHGRPPIELRLRRGARHLLIEVDDGAAAIPRKLRPSPREYHGRGLQLTAAVAERWGARPLREGKSVWCQLPLTRALNGSR